MALKSLRITKKELQTYYTPKVSDYEMMVNSINSNMGYGQIIQAYTSTETGVNVTNTYYHVYDNLINEVVVMDKTSGLKSSIYDAGPNFWGVSPEIGVEFLNGVAGISGLRKLKYCDGCSDGNGLDKPVVDNFSKRFRKVEELVLGNNLLEGFLFYDLELPKYSNVFPAIKKDDGVNITYQFKNVNTGADLTPEDVATITQRPIYEIEDSVNKAPIIKPQEGENTVITSCCDESISYVILGKYTIGEILQIEGLTESICWFIESLTNDSPNLPFGTSIVDKQRSCEACVKLNPCPTSCEDIDLSYSENAFDVCYMGRKRGTFQVNWKSGELFINGECGNKYAEIGYYSNGKNIYYWDQKSFTEQGPCGGGSNNYTIRYCCDEFAETVDAGLKGLTPGTFVYFSADDSDTYPVPCWYVVGPSPKSVSITGTFTGAVYETCKDCTKQTGKFC